MKPEGIFENGDLWFGGRLEEDGKTFFIATDTQGDYETEEIPERFPFVAMTVFPEGTEERFVLEYALAKKIGDARFGSECQHARAKRGYCPDCLRKVI